MPKPFPPTWAVRASSGRATRTAHLWQSGRPLCGTGIRGSILDRPHDYSRRCKVCDRIADFAALGADDAPDFRDYGDAMRYLDEHRARRPGVGA